MSRYALIFSCEEYSEFDDICFCHSDAVLMYETLTSYCDYQRENIELNMLYKNDDTISPSVIYEQITEQISHTNSNDTFLLYFAGHGMKLSNFGYLILPGTKHSDIPNTSLSLATINEIFKHGNCNSFVILDACHSGTISRCDSFSSSLFSSPITEISYATFASCSSNEVSYPDEYLEQGVFTYYFCEEIKKQAINSLIYLEGIKQAVCDNVHKWSLENYKIQTPTLHGALVGNQSFASRNSTIYQYALANIESNQEETVMDNSTNNQIVPSQNYAPALWQSNTGVELPKVANLDLILSYNYQLKDRELKGLIVNYNSALFEIASETVWNRSIAILRKRVLALGVQFVSEMVGIDNLDYIQNLPPFEVINLAMELGFINSTGKMRLMHANEIIQHYIDRETEEEMPQNESDSVIRPCIQYILAYEDSNIQIEYNDFRTSLIIENIIDKPDKLESLKSSPYFYKKTTLRTLVNLIDSTENTEFETVSNNFCSIIKVIWSELTSDDKYFIGLTFSKHKNAGNTLQIATFNTALISVNGFDYVPENLRSISFIEVAKNIKSVHYGLNNFYKEPSAINNLNKMGTKIPKPAIKECIGATLMVLLGNQFGRSFDAVEPAMSVLNKLSDQDWSYYIEQCLIVDEEVLSKISSGGNRTDRWCNICTVFNLNTLEFSDSKISEFIKFSTSDDKNNTRARAGYYLKLLTH